MTSALYLGFCLNLPRDFLAIPASAGVHLLLPSWLHLPCMLLSSGWASCSYHTPCPMLDRCLSHHCICYAFCIWGTAGCFLLHLLSGSVVSAEISWTPGHGICGEGWITICSCATCTFLFPVSGILLADMFSVHGLFYNLVPHKAVTLPG